MEAERKAHDEQQGDWNQEINPVIIAPRDVLIRNGVPLEPEIAHAAAAGDLRVMQNT